MEKWWCLDYTLNYSCTKLQGHEKDCFRAKYVISVLFCFVFLYHDHSVKTSCFKSSLMMIMSSLSKGLGHYSLSVYVTGLLPHFMTGI